MFSVNVKLHINTYDLGFIEFYKYYAGETFVSIWYHGSTINM